MCRCNRLWVLALAGLLCGGCSRGVSWGGRTYQEARSHADEQGRLTLVYFRSWCSVECTRFEEQVLKNKEVLAELDSLVCVPLELGWDTSLAERWGLERVPSYVILDLDERVVASGQAPITLADLLEALRGAKSTRTSGVLDTAP